MHKSNIESQILPPDFNPEEYLELNQDVRVAGADPVKHFLDFGRKEGRVYRKKNKDLELALAKFVTVAPSDQNSFDLFPTSWSSAFDAIKTGGAFNATNDVRIEWLLQHVDVVEKKVLELGPLEAGHTFMLEKAGAKVLAVEANQGAFLRCLIVKNYLDLSARFMLGDFEKMNLGSNSFDLVVASGVLYHMREPVELLKKLSSVADKLFLWTHYFHPDFKKWNKVLGPQIKAGKWEYKNPTVIDVGGFKVRMVKQTYNEALGWSGFCGGTDIYSNWIFKDDLIELLKRLGYSNIEISFDNIEHQNGPSFCVLACK